MIKLLKKRLRFIHIIIMGYVLLYICSSCSTQNIIGTYNLIAPQIFHNLTYYHQLILQDDGNCMLITVSNDTILVKWELEKNNRFIILKPEKSFYTISYCDTCVFNRINVFDMQTKEKIEYAHIQIYHDGMQKDEYITDNTGYILFNRDTYDSIKITFVGYDEVNIKNNNRSYTNMDVFLVFEKHIPIKWKILSRKKIRLPRCCTFIKQD